MNACFHKLESLRGSEWLPFYHPQSYTCGEPDRQERLRVGVQERGTKVLIQLASVLDGPFSVLHLLIIPRGGSVAARYQSPWVDRAGLLELIEEYKDYWDFDGRHEIWIRSDPENAVIVYDRHQFIYAYGPIERFTRVLENVGFGETEDLPLPAPHGHCYHGEFDSMERKLTSLLGWKISPLQPEDGS